MHNFLSLAHLGQNSARRWFKTEFFTFLFTFPGSIPLLIFAMRADIKVSIRNVTAQQLGISDALFLVLLLLPFVTALFGLMWLIPKIHGRHWKTAVTTRPTIDFRRMLVAGGVWGILLLVQESIIFVLEPHQYTWQFDAARFFPMALAAVILIPFQAFAEEFAIRGYLMQNVALISKRVWQPILYTALSFAWLHSSNTEVQTHGLLAMMPLYAIVGLALGITAIMDDGIELAAGVHIANNLYAFTLVGSPEASFHTPTLFVTPLSSPTWISYASLIALCLIFLFVMAKKYRWSAWSLLWSTIEPNQNMGYLPTKKPRMLSDVIAANAAAQPSSTVINQ